MYVYKYIICAYKTKVYSKFNFKPTFYANIIKCANNEQTFIHNKFMKKNI